MSKRNRKSAIAEARGNDQPVATSAVVSLDSSHESQVENPGRHELRPYYVRGRSRLRSRPVPRNLSHPGEVIAARERARLHFFFRTTHPALRLACDGENSGSGSINRPQFPTERVSRNLRTPQIKSTTFEAVDQARRSKYSVRGTKYSGRRTTSEGCSRTA